MINFNFPLTFNVTVHSKRQLIIFANLCREMGIEIDKQNYTNNPVIQEIQKELTVYDIIPALNGGKNA